MKVLLQSLFKYFFQITNLKIVALFKVKFVNFEVILPSPGKKVSKSRRLRNAALKSDISGLEQRLVKVGTAKRFWLLAEGLL